MAGFRSIQREIAGTPLCPMCEGPCVHEFERGPYVFPDRLPKAKDGSADPEPAPPVKVRKRGRRPSRIGPTGPVEDRMHRPESDR